VRTLLLRPRLLWNFLDVFENDFPQIPTHHLKSAAASISIIIPFRDRWDMTYQCLQSINFGTINQQTCDVILIDNGSTEPFTKQGMQSIVNTHKNMTIIHDHSSFNFSKLMNTGVAHCKGQIAILLNNDVIFDVKQFEAFCDLAQRLNSSHKLGALGLTLLYPDETSVQHLFIAPDVKLAGAHPGAGMTYDPRHAWYQGTRRVPAVTGAVWAVDVKNFEDIGGFDESLRTAYQDLEYCMRATHKGYEIFTAAHLKAIHLESATRKRDNPQDQLAQYWQLTSQHTHAWRYPSYLSLWSQRPLLRWFERKFPLNF